MTSLIDAIQNAQYNKTKEMKKTQLRQIIRETIEEFNQSKHYVDFPSTISKSPKKAGGGDIKSQVSSLLSSMNVDSHLYDTTSLKALDVSLKKAGSNWRSQLPAVASWLSGLAGGMQGAAKPKVKRESNNSI